MDNSFLIALGSAFWFGILTSISPCPLATNIAAVSYIGKELEQPRRVVISGVLYTLGRMVSYAILGILLVKSLIAVFETAGFLQKYMNQVLGFFLIVAGLVLLRIIPFPSLFNGNSDQLARKFASMGFFGSFLLGGLFALSFCPISAALFFGSLVPLAIKFQSGILFPFSYGLGTALPVLVFALTIGLSAHAVAHVFNRISLFEKWTRIVTGIIFVVIGAYYLYTYFINPIFIRGI